MSFAGSRVAAFRFAAFSIALVVGFVTHPALAQPGVTTPTNRDKQVMAIYEATKTASSAKDYTEMLEDCENLLAGELSAKHRAYLTSLRGWALNRRGVLRLETAEQLKLAGNTHSSEAMSQAMSDFTEAIKADPNRWRSWLSRGIAFASQAKFDLAVKDFDKVIQLKPDEVKAWFNRGEANYYRGEFEMSISDFTAVLKMTENDLLALTSRGHAYFARAKFPEAWLTTSVLIRYYPIIVRLKSTSAMFTKNLAAGRMRRVPINRRSRSNQAQRHCNDSPG